MRIASRVDANQPEIVAALRKCGATVQHLHQVGHGAPDLLVGYRGMNLLFECKDDNKPLSKRKLTPDEQNFFNTWNGQVDVIENIQEALNTLAARTRGFL
jgi:hypothetical protein